VPELAGIENAVANEAALRKFSRAVRRLSDRVVEEELQAMEGGRVAQENASLIPEEPKIELIRRYWRMNDRKISNYLRFIAEHCISSV
jgi:hypothetical protein